MNDFQERTLPPCDNFLRTLKRNRYSTDTEPLAPVNSDDIPYPPHVLSLSIESDSGSNECNSYSMPATTVAQQQHDVFVPANVKTEPVSNDRQTTSVATPPTAASRILVNPYAKKQRTPGSIAREVSYEQQRSPKRETTGPQHDHWNRGTNTSSARPTRSPSLAATPRRMAQQQQPHFPPSPVSLPFPITGNNPTADAPAATNSSKMGTIEFPKEGSYGFLAAMFRTPPIDYVHFPEAHDNERKALAIWQELCDRTGLSLVKAPIPPVQDTAAEHMQTRASLVLEEARKALAQALTTLWMRQEPIHYESFEDLIVADRLISADRASLPRGFVKYRLCRKPTTVDGKKNQYSAAELECLHGGSIVLLQECGSASVSFAFVQPSSKERLLKFAEFDAIGLDPSVISLGDSWLSPHGLCFGEGMKMIPLDATFVSLSRQFNALTSSTTRTVPFMEVLLGKKGNEVAAQTEATAAPVATVDPVLACLNESQAKVAKTFLSSVPGAITITQGPPGTGKSTLLVSVLLQYVRNRQEGRSRVMVCAPTNKAVSIVATRFLSKIDKQDKANLNIIATGDRDKLRDDGMPDVLKPYFLASWQTTMTQAWKQILSYITDLHWPIDEDTLRAVISETLLLHARLKNSLPGLPKEVLRDVQFVCEQIDNLQNKSRVNMKPAIVRLQNFISKFEKLDASIMREELMRTAHVVFCTLCSAGSSSVMCTNDLDDLIVDEAAAATEPDLYIPFQLRPKRLLIVGDPKQLPSVVLSDRARRLGLAVSLHERLMYRCKYDYIMLNAQYRMHPQIALFPSSRFYENGIENGPNVCHPTYGRNTATLDCLPFTFYQVHCLPLVKDALVSNPLEADVICDLVQSLSSRCTGESNWQSIERIRVISFYKEQVALIRRKLHAKGFKKVFVGTVDSSQGCEADVVLVSFVRGLDKAGFLVDDRRINVALTRARHQLVCVGNVEAMAHLREANAETLRLMSHDASSRGVVTLWKSET